MDLREQLQRDEGDRYEVYTDSLGNSTIGRGTRLPLFQDDVEALYESRLSRLTQELHRAIPWVEQLDDVRWDALRNMAYNMGVPELLGFKLMLDAMRVGQWKLAAIDALDSMWATQVGDRAKRLAKQIETGVMQ